MTPLPVDERPLVILAARMQREKGILEFAAAANRLRLLGVAARCVLVGGADRDNPAGLTADALTQLCSAVHLSGGDTTMICRTCMRARR